MRQGRWFSALVAVAVAAGILGSGVAHAAGRAESKSTVASARAAKTPSRKSANSLRQFTGWVTAVDKSGLTVEKRGKAPRTMTFVRHEEMKTVGDVAKDARVTVYYREDGGRPVAHRVVVKERSTS